MKIARRIAKAFFFIFLFLDIAIFTSVFMLDKNIDNSYKINRGDTLTFDTEIPVTAEYQGAKLSQSLIGDSIGETFSVDLKIFGLIPFSTVDVEVVDEMYVAVLGNPFGMKLYTEGVLVIDMTAVDTKNGNINPAESAGVKKGDYIVSANGVMIYTNEELSKVVKESQGEEINLEILRNGENKTMSVLPAFSEESQEYRIGLWIRDSSAGIGTLTFYSPATGVVCGLGHGICDEDTGSLLQLNSGEIVDAEILSVAKGSGGSPGELKGRFKYDTLADISLNCECGVYGFLNGTITPSNLTEVALKQEVEDGEAQILCTVEGETPRLYSCTIKKRSSALHSETQNIIVTVTDKELLEKTGGIVQGMSGSPLIQNGKLIGAVTHVLVDDPTKGYAIFAENMLETSQSVSESNKLKDVS